MQYTHLLIPYNEIALFMSNFYYSNGNITYFFAELSSLLFLSVDSFKSDDYILDFKLTGLYTGILKYASLGSNFICSLISLTIYLFELKSNLLLF